MSCFVPAVMARRLTWLLSIPVLLLAAAGASAYVPPAIDAGGAHAADPALGINDVFGRWNSTVKLVYDPDAAPSQFSQTKFLTLLDEAIEQWEMVSGIRFEVTGVDRTAPDDVDRPIAQRDGLVRIHWGATNGFAGLAGPQYGNFDQSLGYYTYYDGDVLLNQDASSWDSDTELVSTLVHEFGHLIGLGHSDVPVSIMYANPYNNLNYPRADDIAAAQALYGVGSNGITPASGVSAWRYSAPAVGSVSTSQFLFKPNEFTSTGAFLSLQASPDTAITSISNSAPDNQFVLFNTGGIGGFTNNSAIDIDARLVLVDPDGYLYKKSVLSLQCNARTACGGAFVGSITAGAIKTYPGKWKFLVVDETSGSLLQTLTLDVSATTVVNKAPLATVSAVQGATPAQVTLTLAVTDSENNNVTVTWHPPGKPLDNNNDGINDGGLVQSIGKTGTAVQTFDYSLTGTYTLFVELKDDSARYNGTLAGSSSAGDGFSNLLQLTITLPLSSGGVNVLAQYGAGSGTTGGNNSGGGGTATTLTTIAAAQSFASVSTGGATSASFTMGASKDSGASTSTSFKPGDSIQVAGAVKPQTADIGKPADLFVVIRAVLGGRETWLYRDSTGAFRPWNFGAIAELRPALETTSLQTGTTVEAYKGPVGVGTFQVFIGYKLDSSNTLHYSSTPLLLNVAN